MRDFKKHRDLIFSVHPPAAVEGEGSAPLSWYGGLGRVDFGIGGVGGGESALVIEAKASTRRGSEGGKPKRDSCDCVVESSKLCEEFRRTGGWVFHFHPWSTKALEFPANPPSKSVRGGKGVRGVLERLLRTTHYSDGNVHK